MKRGIHPFLRRLLLDERGISLVASVGVLAVLTTLGVAAVEFSSAGSRSSSYSATSQKAVSNAEAGHSMARATLVRMSRNWRPPAQPSPTRFGPNSFSLEGGDVTYWAEANPTGFHWTLYGRGTFPNPAGGDPIVRTVSSKMVVVPGTGASTTHPIYSYLYAWDPYLCSYIRDRSVVEAPLYVNASLCMSGNGDMRGDNLQVNGAVSLFDTAKVGTPGNRIREAHIAGGCRTVEGPFHACTAADRVYANVLDANPTDIDPPALDLERGYRGAAPGPLRPCPHGENFPGGFDNNSSFDQSRVDVNLTSLPAFDCQVKDAAGSLIGRLAWIPRPGGRANDENANGGRGSRDGTLIVHGTVFFDGDIVLEGTTDIVYEGRGTIYSSGTISIVDDASLCADEGCNATWDTDDNLLALVAGEPTTGSWWGFKLWGNASFQGVLYSTMKFWATGNADLWGPALARYFWLADNTRARYVPFDRQLDGLPGGTVTTWDLQPVPGSYRN